MLQQAAPLQHYVNSGAFSAPVISDQAVADPAALQVCVCLCMPLGGQAGAAAGIPRHTSNPPTNQPTNPTQADGLLQLPALLAAYAARNLTTAFTNQYPVWTAAAAGAGGSGDFTLDVMVRIPPHQLLLYRPLLGEMLKWGWVQFLGAFALVWWLASWFEWAVFRFRVLDTRVVSDLTAVRPKFS